MAEGKESALAVELVLLRVCIDLDVVLLCSGLVLNGHRLLELVTRRDSQVELHGHIQLDNVPLRHMQT